jgi:hypothetical protein
MIIISRDGRSWHPATGTQPFAGPDTAFAQAAAGPAGYVVVGSATGASGRPGPAAWHSASLGTWQRAAIPLPGADAAGGPPAPRQMLGVTADRSGFTAVGSTGNLPAVWTSQTGSAWQLTTLPMPTGAASAVLTAVAAVGQRVLAIGSAVHATGPGHPLPAPMPFTATSTDGGRTWHETVPHGQAAPTAVTALTATGKGFVAAGLTGPAGHQAMVVWWSSGGRTWQGGQTVGRPAGAQGAAQLTALSAEGGVLTGAGYAVTASGEHPFRWQARFR